MGTTGSVCMDESEISNSVISAYSTYDEGTSLRMSRSSPPVVIFVHGLYGCYLSKKKDGESPISSLFTTPGFQLPTSALKSFVLGNSGHSHLALPITWSKSTDGSGTVVQIQDKDDFYPSDDFQTSHSELFLFLDTLHEKGLIELHKIRWDWRRSFEDSEKHISSKIQDIFSGSRSNNDPLKATIITHSTGALLSWPTINKHPEWFTTWLNVAGAVGNSNVSLHELKYDWMTPGAEFIKLLSKEVLFTFPSQYGFFRVIPDEPFRGDYESEFVSSSSEKYFLSSDSIDLYNVKDWEKFKLGIFGWKNGEVTEAEREHLKNCLEASKRFRTKNIVRPGKPDDDDSFLENERSAYDHLEIICYGTDSIDTHASYEVDLENNSVECSNSKLVTTGDGTLRSNNWKHVFGGLKKKIVYAEEGSNHVSMCVDAKLKEIMMELFFPDDERREQVEDAFIAKSDQDCVQHC